MAELRYGDLTFDKGFLSAARGTGEPLRFTRQERALLGLFTENVGRLLSRGQILDAISFVGSDTSDRNVDFLVNRLRAKLGDNPRAPRFIATQYGEGYLWIAKPARDVDAFLVIGPCYGLGDAPTKEMAGEVLGALSDAIEASMARKQRVAVVTDWQASQRSKSVAYALEAGFHTNGALLHAAFVLRAVEADQIVRAFRARFTADSKAEDVQRLATQMKDAIWAHRALPIVAAPIAPTERPLELRMHDAARLITCTPESWHKSRQQIEQARADNPDDPSLAIMQGLALYADLVQHVRPPQDWHEIETEIERLVLDCLPAIQDNPLLVLGAAKLLFFIDRGHFDLASRLADEAFEKSTAFAAAFATLGQMRMAEGAFLDAHLLYDKALELAEAGSEFFVYLKVLKCTASLAAGDRATVDALAAELFAINPIIRMQLGLFLASPDKDLPADLGAVLASVDASRASSLLSFLYNTSARHFRAPEHRANVMRGLLTHVSRRFGEAAVPEAVVEGIGLARV